MTVKWKDESGCVMESTGTIKNMSPSGACVVFDSPIGEGCVIHLHIDIPVALGGSILSRISAKGRVVRSVGEPDSAEAFGHGIMFDHLSFTRL